jgi:hypothetical protein
LEVCYLDLNGPNNTGGHGNPEILRLYPPWNPTEYGQMASGVLQRAQKILEKVSLSPSEVEALFMARVSALHNSLGLPVAPDEAWPRISQKLWKSDKRS